MSPTPVRHASKRPATRGGGAEDRGVESPPFRFRLERLRTLRAHSEDLAKEQYAAALAHRVAAEGLLLAAHERVDGAHETMRSSAAAPADANQLRAVQAWLERTEGLMAQSHVEVDRREQAVTGRREELHHASRERQVLERLRERRRAAHQIEVGRAEVSALDELGLAVHRRQRKAS